MFRTYLAGSIVNSNAQGLVLVGVDTSKVTNTCGWQAIYNVLTTYFEGHRLEVIMERCQSSAAALPLNYLQIYYEDVIYANTNSTGSLVRDGFGNNNLLTA